MAKKNKLFAAKKAKGKPVKGKLKAAKKKVEKKVEKEEETK